MSTIDMNNIWAHASESELVSSIAFSDHLPRGEVYNLLDDLAQLQFFWINLILLLYYLTIIENFSILGYLCPSSQWGNSIDTCVKLGDHLNLFNCHHKYSNQHQLRLRSRFQIHRNLTWSKNINYVELQYCSNLSKCTVCCVACILITVKCQCYVYVHTQREATHNVKDEVIDYVQYTGYRGWGKSNLLLFLTLHPSLAPRCPSIF